MRKKLKVKKTDPKSEFHVTGAGGKGNILPGKGKKPKTDEPIKPLEGYTFGTHPDA